MRDAVRRLFSVRPQPRIVQVRVPSIIAGRRGLPVLLSAFAVVAAASTAATTSVSQQGAVAAPAGTTVLPPVAPPTYSYPGSPVAGTPLPSGARPPGGTGLNGGRSGGTASTQLAANGIPSRAVRAYQQAAVAAGCGIPWTLVAAIGRVESNHGQFGGATLLSDGRSDPPIIGIPLDGRPGVAEIKDTDGGKWDGDTTYDRAVGPMQFIPSSWAIFGVDGDGDGKIDPFDIDDAAAVGREIPVPGRRWRPEQRGQPAQRGLQLQPVDDVCGHRHGAGRGYAGGAPIDGSPAPNGTPRPLPPLAHADAAAGHGRVTRPPCRPRPRRARPARPTATPTVEHAAGDDPTVEPGPDDHAAVEPGRRRPPSRARRARAARARPVADLHAEPERSPSPSPSSSGTNTPNGTASAAGTPAGAAATAPHQHGQRGAATGTPTADPDPPALPQLIRRSHGRPRPPEPRSGADPDPDGRPSTEPELIRPTPPIRRARS